jgi:hypothetical protein
MQSQPPTYHIPLVRLGKPTGGRRRAGGGAAFLLLIVTAVTLALLLTACRLGATTYVVKSVGDISDGFATVTCWEKDVAGSEFTKEWAVFAETGPEVGDEWHCN